MTYKTLRRKSDGQWMRYNYTCIYEVTYPVPTPVSSGSKIDWSLYELVEVAVIPVDALPSDEDIWKEINARIPDEYYAQETGKIINRYKSQILKP